MNGAQIYLIDDSDNYRDVMKGFLERNGYTVVGASRHQTLIPRLQVDPGIVILSFRETIGETSTTIDLVKSVYPDTKIAILASVYDKISVDDIKQLGVDGLLYKAGENAEEILDMLKQLLMGQKYFK
jgi:DNA-binding NarL/FixJ family response regulator